MHVHEKAPLFELPDQNGEIQKLIYYKKKWVVLYFYPKDGTPGCTKEACQFRDNLHELESRGVVILGVSLDSVQSHKEFAAKYNLNFPLLADTDASVSKAYGAWAEDQFEGKPGVHRITFLIDPDGDIAKKYTDVDPISHVTEILQDLEELTAEL